MFKRRRFRQVVAAVIVVLALGVVLRLVGAVILRTYARAKVEQAFNEVHPGVTLRLGRLHFALWSNRLTVDAVTLTSPNQTIEAGPGSLKGVRWYQLWRDPAGWTNAVADAALEAENVTVDFLAGRYRLRCGRLQASVPASNLVVERLEFHPRMDDEGFFAASAYRAARFRAEAAQGRMIGLEIPALLQGTAFRARSIVFESPRLDVLLNREKPVEPLAKRPPMVHEALAAFPIPLEIGALQLTNGFLDYDERFAAGASPARITMTSLELSARGIANGGGTTPMRIEAQTQLMNASKLKLAMSIPLDSPEFSFHYSGSLGTMDLRSLNPFLEISDHTRIRSGMVQAAAFDIEVTAGHAIGRVQGSYRDLRIDVLDTHSLSDQPLRSRVSTIIANTVKIRNANPSEVLNRVKSGTVEYWRKADDEFVEFVWQALRTGVLDIINH